MEKNEVNMQKYRNYAEQSRRLNRALADDFNLEAVFIEYAILEDRTESVLRHAEKWEAYMKKRNGRGATIDSKIRYILKMAESKKEPANKYFSDNTLSDVLDWKEERNRLIHALLKQSLEQGEIRNLAIKGKELVDKVKKSSSNFNRACDRLNKSEN